MMEGRMSRRYRYGSPERLKERTDSQLSKQRSRPQQLLQPGMKVSVVYYLYRNRHLEHPHFIEVPLSSQRGLFLKDVMDRLNELRGKGMASLYSWSCKRSYKNGFVWHDLSEDDLIVPANGNEYVLKGSEFFDPSASDRCHDPNSGLPNSPKLLSPNSQCSPPNGSNQSPTMVHEDQLSPPLHRESSSSRNASNSPVRCGGSQRPVKIKVREPCKAIDASTQTDTKTAPERRGRRNIDEHIHNQQPRLKESTELCNSEISPPPTSSSTPSSNGKVDTLESLIRAEARKRNNVRCLEEEDVLFSTGSKLRAANVLMQLLTCGSTSVKNHKDLGLVHYQPTFANLSFASPISGSSVIFKDRNRIQVKEEEKIPPCSLSFVDDRNIKLPNLVMDEEDTEDPPRRRRPSQTMKVSTGKQLKRDTTRSRSPDSRQLATTVSNSDSSSKNFTYISSKERPSSSLESFSENGKILKIEERLPSGARIIIQSRCPFEDSDNSSSP